jgi:hypothetical protein
MSDEDEEDSRALGFRDPPINISRACLGYKGRVMELRGFIGFYFNFVKTSQKLAPLVAAHKKAADASEEGFVSIEYNFSKHRQLVNEIVLSRAVESFDLYVLGILRAIFEAKPEILKSAKSVDVATLIELRTAEEIIFYLAERQVNELGYKPLSELRKWVLQRTGIDLFKSDEIFEMALLGSEVRNLIAHNDCVANETIIKRVGERSSKLDISDSGKVRISDEWLRKVCYTLDGVVFDFDQAAGDKFDVYRSNRLGTFFIRE